MMKVKVGGMILTGLAAFLVAGRTLDTVNRIAGNACEAAKWKGYYKCWSRGNASGEPVAPGYSRTTRPDNANYEVVEDPYGADHSRDNEPEPKQEHNSTDSVKAVCEAVKAVAEKAIDSLNKRSDEAREASEGQTEAYEDENMSAICEDQVQTEESDLEHVINGAFGEQGEENEKETDDHETVD